MSTQYALQILVNAGGSREYWDFDLTDFGVQTTPEEATAALREAERMGYRTEHLRVVEIRPFRPKSGDD